MNQRRRGIPEALVCSGAFRFAELFRRMKAFGLEVNPDTAFPAQPAVLETGPALTHLCFGNDEEFFPAGVPVFGPIEVKQNGSCRTWRASLQKGIAPYWCNKMLLLHDWTRPDSLDWRPLHFLEAASLLAMYPGLGAVRYFSPNGSANCTELFLRKGNMFVWCGNSPRGHHAAFTVTLQVAPDKIHERRI
ncbi:MAG: hypothetical protein WC840_05775 [Candidatus Peribacteraceae bacterium]